MDEDDEDNTAALSASIDAVTFVDTGACMLLIGAPSVGKSTLLWRLHHAHRPAAASMRLASLLDAVSAKTCRETLLAFCRGPAPHGGHDEAADTPPLNYDRQLIVDDVDTLPKNVQCILAALMDRFRPHRERDDNNIGVTTAAGSAAGRCRFVFSCTAMAKVHAALQTRLPCVRLVPPSSAALSKVARDEAERRGLQFSPELWRAFCAQHCSARVNPRAALAALHRISLLASSECGSSSTSAAVVQAVWLHDVRLDAFDALLRDASRATVVDAYRELREEHGLAPADLLDALYLHVRDHAITEWLSPIQKYQWFELIGRAMRGLPPFLVVAVGGEEAAASESIAAPSNVPWFSVLIASEKSLL